MKGEVRKRGLERKKKVNERRRKEESLERTGNKGE